MKRLQNPGGNTIANDDYVGLPRQFTIDTDRWEIRLHDGETPGGHRILNLQQLLEIFMSKDSEFGQVVFSEDARGYLVRIGDRQYAMRSLAGTTGISITNPAATEGNSVIALDLDYLKQLFLEGIAGRLAFAVTTGSVAPCTAYAATLPNHWPNVNGALAAVLFHADAGVNATLTISQDTTPTPTPYSVLPIKDAQGSVLTKDFIRQGMLGLVMYVDDGTTESPNPAYRLIATRSAASIPIKPITGLTSGNVQAALEELYGKISGLGGGGDTVVDLNSLRKFPNKHQVIGQITVPIADGEIKVCGGSGSSTQAASVQVNGRTYVSARGEIHGPGVTASFSGIIYRKGQTIWIASNAPDFGSSDIYVRITDLKTFLILDEGEDSFTIKPQPSGTAFYTDVGVVFGSE